jgi:hypothetical protein
MHLAESGEIGGGNLKLRVEKSAVYINGQQTYG